MASRENQQYVGPLPNNAAIDHCHIDMIMHLVYPLKLCITIVFNFSWVSRSSQENSKTMVI